MIRERLVVIGAGGHGAEVGTYLNNLCRAGWDGKLLGYLDDASVTAPGGAPVLGSLMAFVDCPPDFFPGLHYVTAIGSNTARHTVVRKLQELYADRFRPWTLRHPNCYVGEHVDIGEGSCLAPGAIVTCRAEIGRHCILNVKASVSHDCAIGDYVNLNPGATICGNVRIGDGAYIGAGATVKDKVTIGAWSIIGAGAAVVDDIPPNVTAVGVPARIIKDNRVQCASTT
jgi:acetyltransferase EpsM